MPRPRNLTHYEHGDLVVVLNRASSFYGMHGTIETVSKLEPGCECPNITVKLFDVPVGLFPTCGCQLGYAEPTPLLVPAMGSWSQVGWTPIWSKLPRQAKEKILRQLDINARRRNS